ncbi:MAG: hypothetical protein NVSMB38_41420 [Ktedonobacteraceae bacterium]
MSDRNNLIGRQLGSYRLVRELGEGGFASVYLGRHVYLDTTVAVKVLNVRLDKQESQNFLAEARTLARLVHPHIVRILDFGVEEVIPFLTMDYAPNGTLRDRYTKEMLMPLHLVVEYVNQVAQALQYAHEQGIIHRDIKPANMLLNQNNSVLLSDFGIASFVSNDDSAIMTAQNIVGTLAYMSPEQFEGKSRRASDQYSLGIVVYEWLIGRTPFRGDFIEQMHQRFTGPPPSLRSIDPRISPAVEQVVMKALARQPEDRFKDIADFALALERAEQGFINPEVTTFPTAYGQQVQPRTAPPAIQLPSLDKPASLLRKVGKAIRDSLNPATPPSNSPTQYPQEPPALPPVLVTQDTCLVCRAEIRPSDAYCLNCGAPITQNATQTSPSTFNNEPGTIATRFVQLPGAVIDPTVVGVGEEASFITVWPPIPDKHTWGAEDIPTVEIKPPDANVIAQLMQEGEQYYKARQYDDALDKFNRIVTLDAQNIVAHGYKGNALGKLRRHKEALAAYTTALTINAQHNSLWSAKGDILVKLRRMEDALGAYDEALKINSQDGLTWFAKAGVLARLKRYEQAIEAYTECLNLKPQDAASWAAKGNMLAKMGRNDEALEAYDTTLKYDKHDVTVWEAKGKLLGELQRHEDALAMFKQATLLFPKKVEMWLARSDVFAALERYDEAIEDCKHAHLLKPGDQAIEQKYTLLQQLKQHKDSLARIQAQQAEAKRKSATAFSDPKENETRNFFSHASTVRFTSIQASRAPETQRFFRGNPTENVTREVDLYDVFLSHADEDRDLVEELANTLEDEHKLSVWLYERMQIPGGKKQQVLMQGLQSSRCYAICIGQHTPMAWFRPQIEIALEQQATKALRVIPVLLPNAPNDIEIDEFLKQNMLVNFRDWEHEYAFHALVCGIKGIPIGRWSPKISHLTTQESPTEEKLRELHHFVESQLVDKDLSIEMQRIILRERWLGIDDTKGKH